MVGRCVDSGGMDQYCGFGGSDKVALMPSVMLRGLDDPLQVMDRLWFDCSAGTATCCNAGTDAVGYRCVVLPWTCQAIGGQCIVA